ncbi:MAG: o-succinylbenzoate synthase [Actinomycetota bacterium]
MTVRCFRIPLRHRFRQLDVREGILVHGPSGWGELSPFADYSEELTKRCLASALEAAGGTWPPARRASIPVNVTVPAVEPERAHAIVIRSGCTTAKVKVADGDDEARVEAVRDALGPLGHIRVDANGAWGVDDAAARIARLARHGLEYVEQPVASLGDMARVRTMVDVPLAVDESIRTAEDPLLVKALGAADVVVLKVQPLGGVRAALQVAEACGLPVVVSSALETSIGLSAGLALAAALPELPYACGLGTAALLEGDVVADPLVPVEGGVEVRRPEVDESCLRRYETSIEQTGEWTRHLAQLASEASEWPR